MNLVSYFRSGECYSSYAQCGEDRIIAHIFSTLLNIDKPSYLDIGAHHPFFLSNTYLFYQNGSAGVCVEPDPELCAYFKRKRKRDTCLNIGISVNGVKESQLYVMSVRALNTFSKETADRLVKDEEKQIENIVPVSMMPINQVIERYYSVWPNLVSLDTEGFDLEILQSLDFERYRPEVICAETLTYSMDKSERKLNEIIDFVKSKDYIVYADTYINTIFVEHQTWSKRLSQ
jgi:FkbM family methyltransferase